MLSREAIQKIAQKILQSIPRELEGEVLISASDRALTRFANNVVTQNVYSETIEISLRLLQGQKVSRVSTNNPDGDVSELITRATEILEYQPDNPELLPLPEKQLYRVINRYDPKVKEFGPAQKGEVLKEVCLLCKEKNLSGNGALSNNVESTHIANSKGVSAYHEFTTLEFNLIVKTPSSTGRTNFLSHRLDELNHEDLTKRAIKNALDSQEPIEVEANKYDVILEPLALDSIITFLCIYGFSTLAILENRNCLADKLGKQIFSNLVSISDDAYHPKIIGIPFDYEGMPKKIVPLIENGVFSNIVHDRKTAKKANRDSTGHALPEPNVYGPIPMNIVFKEGSSSLEEMIKNTKEGLLIKDFHYCNLTDHYNLILTGMTRHGTFLIKNGKIDKPVKNMRFTQSIISALNNVEAVSRETISVNTFFGSGMVLPAVKIREFNFSSTTTF